MTKSKVQLNDSQSAYELAVGGATAVSSFRRESDTLLFTHTEVPEEMEGQGLASELVAGALADARAKGLKVRPLCSFVRHYVETHPDTHDLLA